MDFYRIIKTLLLSYLMFAGIFLLCVNDSHELYTIDGRHSASMNCPINEICNEAMHGHAQAAVPLAFASIALALFVLVAVFYEKIYLFFRTRGYLYIKWWRDHGGGLHLFDFFQYLFSQGLLNSKVPRFVIA